MTTWFVVAERYPSRSKNAVGGTWPQLIGGGPYLDRQDAEARIRSLSRRYGWKKADLFVMTVSDD